LGEELGIFFGTVGAKVSDLTGVDTMFQISIFLEEKAICDYRQMIKEVDNWELAQTLWNNLIEEDLHCSWFKIRRDNFKASLAKERSSSAQ
jgi:bacterioferritin